VALAKTLIDQPEILLLDEPTNHLDTQTIEWLEGYLEKSPATCLFVTHDRYFLDRVCTRILELQAAKIYSYSGNYSEYLRQRAARDEAAAVQETRRLAFIRRELDWIRRGPKARGTKSWSRIQRFNDAVNTALNNILSGIITFVGVIAMMLWISPLLCLISACFLVCMYFLVKFSGSRSRFYFVRQQKQLGALNGYIQEIISGLKVVKVTGHEREAVEGFCLTKQ